MTAMLTLWSLFFLFIGCGDKEDPEEETAPGAEVETVIPASSEDPPEAPVTSKFPVAPTTN